MKQVSNFSRDCGLGGPVYMENFLRLSNQVYIAWVKYVKMVKYVRIWVTIFFFFFSFFIL